MDRPYLGRCRNMTFGELVRFIDRAKRRVSGPWAIDDDEVLPRSKEDLLELCAMLKVKADALKEDAPKPLPERPVYDGPADPGPFIPSGELAALYARRKPHERRVEEAIEDRESETYVEYVEGELEKVELEVAPLDRSEKVEHDKRLSEYYAARRAYRRRVQLWESEAEKVKKRRQAEANREWTVRRMYREIELAFQPKPTGRVQWEAPTNGRGGPKRHPPVLRRTRAPGEDRRVRPGTPRQSTALPYVE